MKKLFKRIKMKKNANNSGMTLVEVMVATTIFGILAGMIFAVANYSIHSQMETKYWNEQTDMQSTFVAEKRNSLDPEFTEMASTKYIIQIDTGTETIDASSGNELSLISVNTQTEGSKPTDEEHHLRFFRVK